MKILITGGCGFVGSNLAFGLKTRYPRYDIVVLDNLKRRGSELNIRRLKDLDISFIHGDIRHFTDFEAVGEVDMIIDAAAEPSVLAGQSNGLDYLIETNLNGTINTLKFANENGAGLIFLSTSRVYPIPRINEILIESTEKRFQLTSHQTLNGVSENGINEHFSLEGYRSLYGSTKLASELFAQEFNALGLRTVINRCGVIAGPYQMGKVDQGVAVLWMARHFWRKPLSYIGYDGSGKQVRDFLHVDDLLELIDWQLHNLSQVNGEVFNVGGGLKNSASLLELTNLCQEITGNKIDFNKVAEDRPGDIPIYVSDIKKVKDVCNWSPRYSLKNTLEDIYAWILQNQQTLKPILN